MITLQRIKGRRKTMLYARASEHLPGDSCIISIMTQCGKQSTTVAYHCERIRNDMDDRLAFALEPFQIDRAAGHSDLHVLLDMSGKGNGSCECKGWLQYRVCKHQASLMRLLEVGEIKLADPRQEGPQIHEAQASCERCDSKGCELCEVV
jgi:hypothetical protein